MDGIIQCLAFSYFLSCGTQMAYGSCTDDIPVGCTCHNYTTIDNLMGLQLKCNGYAQFNELPEGFPTDYYKSIKIENNTINTIQHAPFGSVLKFLHLSRNGIQSIQNGSFANLTNLYSLDLAFNVIRSVCRSTFLGLSKLHVLSLKGNQFHVLKSDTFVGDILPQLENLDLDDCELYEIEDAAVNSLPQLVILTLMHNRLRHMPVLGCNSHSLQLISFDVSYNEISEVRPSSCQLSSLTQLYLSHNRIQTLNASFYGPSLNQLTVLHLDNNRISSIHSKAFDGAQNMTVLDLKHNELTAMDKASLPWERLQTLYVEDNPWACVCGNLWLVTQKAVWQSNKEERLRCSTPPRYHNHTVSSVREVVFEKCRYVNHHVVSIVIGVICGLLALTVCLIVIYFAFSKRRSHTNIGGTTGVRTGSSIYRRMNSDNDVLFEYATGNVSLREGTNSEKKPVWKEMSTYEENIGPFSI